MTADPTALAYGAVVAALRDDREGVHALLDGLDPDQLERVAAAALMGTAALIRDNFPPEAFQHVITTVQAMATEHAAQ